VKEDWMEDDSSSSGEQIINYSKGTDNAYAATRFNSLKKLQGSRITVKRSTRELH